MVLPTSGLSSLLGTPTKKPHRRLRWILLPLTLAALCITAPTWAQDWPQWGGPERDFQAPGPGLRSWGDSGPEILWQKPLGPGYSAVTAVGDTLYTLYRADEDEVVVALSADDGSLRWQHRYPAPHSKGMRLNYGEGPESTALWVDGRLFTIGITGRMHALDAATGEVHWTVDLWGDLGGSLLVRGYGASPVAYGDWVLVPVGGEEHGIVALSRDDGSIAWSSEPFDNSPSSPRILEVDGRDLVVIFANDEVQGIDPRDGTRWWSHRHPAGGAYNITTPVWDADSQNLFLSSAYGGGSRLLHLGFEGDTATVDEVWSSNKIKVHFTNGVLVGEHLYTSNGRSGGIMALCVELATGKILWRDRNVARSNFLVVDDRAVALDEYGTLRLLRLGPENLGILGEFQLVEGRTWTAPSLVGNRLYVRDESTIWALELPAED